MIRMLNPLPRSLYVACSGGVDSMAAVDFLRRRHQVQVAFFHHGTVTSDQGWQVVRAYCAQHGLELKIGHITQARPVDTSPEEHWRNQRYDFLDSLPGRDPVVIAHHLDDAVETWIWGSCHGQPRVMDYQRGRCVRPFLPTPKSELEAWAQRHGVIWSEDTTNLDRRYSRNQIRHGVMPEILRVNPGIAAMIRRKVIDKNARICYSTVVANAEKSVTV